MSKEFAEVELKIRILQTIAQAGERGITTAALSRTINYSDERTRTLVQPMEAAGVIGRTRLRLKIGSREIVQILYQFGALLNKLNSTEDGIKECTNMANATWDSLKDGLKNTF